MKTLVLFVSASLSALCVTGASRPLAVMPFTYVGRIVDANHAAYDATVPVELRLKDLSGNLLAKGRTYSSSTSAYNYRLDVPMASSPADGFATRGQLVTFELVEAPGTLSERTWAGLVPASKCAVGRPGGLCRCDIVVAEDENGNGVADEYEAYMGWLMYQHDVEGEYDPNADYDGDGASNYAEYVAGTDPFDAGDRLGFSSLAAAPADDAETLVFTFVPAAGRLYTVQEVPSLDGKSAWTRGLFRLAKTLEQVSRFAAGKSVGEPVTIYLTKRQDASSGFYRLDVE